MNSTPPDLATQPPVPRSRRWLFRLAAVAAGLMVFALAEAVCVLFGWGRPSDYDDPFVGFNEVHPLFVLDEAGERYEIARSRRQFFAADSFPAQKGPGTFRVFCLGGSTVQGRPYSIETSFTTYLRLALETADSSRTWEVVNCGGVSYASYRLAPILQECLAHQPDLLIVMTGHNEFLEERTYSHVKYAPAATSRPARLLGRLRTFTLLRSAVLKLAGQSWQSDAKAQSDQLLRDEVDALLDYREGLRAYRRDDAWREGVIGHFESGVRRMLAIAEAAGVPVILVLPPSNLADSPPFKSEHKSGLSEKDLARWEYVVTHAQNDLRRDLPRAIERLEQATEVDDRHAATWYELGQSCLTLAEREPFRAADWRGKARRAFIKARDEDICPLRMLSPMEDALRRVAEESGTPLLDAHALLEAEDRDGLLGGPLLVDHIHPSPDRGHRLIASALAMQLEANGFVEMPPGWSETRDRRYREHFESLDEIYFLRGQQRLENLHRWTRGQADGPPVDLRQEVDERWRDNSHQGSWRHDVE